MRFVCIGGMNLDVTGYCPGQMSLHDSNPGTIRFSPGGVARNIAAGLVKAGQKVSLITAVTDDLPGLALKADCERLGIDLKQAVCYDGSASSYLSLHTSDGDMLAAVNDMAAMNAVTVDALTGALSDINACDACVVDANLSGEVLRFLAEQVTAPLIADPVSMHKSAALKPILSRLAAFKPNLSEAQELTGETEPGRAALALWAMGVRRVILSLGSEGVYALDENGGEYLRPKAVYPCQTTGAGDTLCAGIALGTAKGCTAAECACIGMDLCDTLLRERC